MLIRNSRFLGVLLIFILSFSHLTFAQKNIDLDSLKTFNARDSFDTSSFRLRDFPSMNNLDKNDIYELRILISETNFPDDFQDWNLNLNNSYLHEQNSIIGSDKIVSYNVSLLKQQFMNEYRKKKKYDLGEISQYLGLSKKISAVILAIISVL